MNALVGLPVEASPVSCVGRVAIAQRISSLLCEREANQKALGAAIATFDLPPTPDELTVTYRGPFGPIQVDVDPEWIHELLADLSPRSRRGRRPRRLLRLHEEHYARLSTDREASGREALIDEKNRIEGELEAAAKEACSLPCHSVGHVALQAASLMAVKLGSFHDHKDAPAVLQGLLDCAGAA